MKKVIDISYDSATKESSIQFEGRRMSTERIRGIPIEEWGIPFVKNGAKWYGIYEELNYIFENEQFCVNFHGSEKDMQTLQKILPGCEIRLKRNPFEKKNFVHIFYNSETKETGITYGEKKADVTELSKVPLSEWQNPFVKNGFRWYGLYEELKKICRSTKFSVIFHGSDADMQLLKEILSSEKVEIFGENNKTVILYDHISRFVKVTVNGKMLDTSIIKGIPIEQTVSPIKELGWNGIFTELQEYMGNMPFSCTFMGRREDMKCLIAACPEQVDLTYKDLSTPPEKSTALVVQKNKNFVPNNSSIENQQENMQYSYILSSKNSMPTNSSVANVTEYNPAQSSEKKEPAYSAFITSAVSSAKIITQNVSSTMSKNTAAPVKSNYVNTPVITPEPVVMPAQPQNVDKRFRCPRCGSQNYTIQAVNEKKEHGILWWLCIGWWLFMILGIFMFLGKKHKTVSRAVCQSCGHNWKI